ncbi:MAG: M1 family aminopeptidase, partial [Planctomycetota bacterium]
MFSTFFNFEWKFWMRGMMVYVFLLIIGFMAFGAAFTDIIQIGGGIGKVNRNAPFVIQSMYGVMSILTCLMTAAFVNGAASRDFIYNTNQIVFTKPLDKFSYVMGRYWGSVLVSTIPMLGVSLGILIAHGARAGYAWYQGEPLEYWGPVFWSAHFWAIMLFVIPNTIFISAIIFAIAVYTRSTISSFLGALGLIVGSAMAESFTNDLDNKFLANMLDPFGETAFASITEYWTVADKNSQIVTFGGDLFANRILWMIVGMGVLGLAYWRFTFTERMRKGKPATAPTGATNTIVEIPKVSFNRGFGTQLRQLFSQIKVDFFETIKSNVFIVVMVVCLLQTGFGLWFSATEGFGLQALPVTYNMVTLIKASQLLFLVGLIIFYAGVLVWKERDARLDEVYDALPQATWTIYTGKLISLTILTAIIIAIGILAGVLVQAGHGFNRHQLGLYIKELLVIDLIGWFCFIVLAMFAHIVSPNKYIGYFFGITLMIVNTFVWSWAEINTRMVRYGDLPGYTYSDMFLHKPYEKGIIGFSVYWLLFAGLVAIGCILYWQRGKETAVSRRLSAAVTSFRGPFAAVGLTCLAAWLGSAWWVYNNTMVVNEVTNTRQVRKLRADYEKKFKSHQDTVQPNITAAKYTIDVFPERRGLKLVGEQTIVNRSEKPIENLYLNFTDGYDTTVEVENAQLIEMTDEEKEFHDEILYYIYRFDPPMAPGQELKMSYTVAFEPEGFENSVSNTSVVQNGTFFNNMIVPQIGYEPGFELTEESYRKEAGLEEERDRMPALDNEDMKNRYQTYIRNTNEWVDVETVISTSEDQMAIAPGSLIKKWQENGRNYYHYKVDHPSLNFYSFISADYEVAVRQWKGVDIEVYYHKEHEWNVDNMLRSIRDSLEYYTENFGPYRHKQARIIEFPRVASFAQAFPGTMPYSEGIGFIADISKDDDVDMVYYVVAHEMAHQWWAHQVIGSNMQGSTLLSETMAQYSALMVMEKEYGRDMMRKFLQYEMDNYLKSRGNERLKEQPLVKVES